MSRWGIVAGVLRQSALAPLGEVFSKRGLFTDDLALPPVCPVASDWGRCQSRGMMASCTCAVPRLGVDRFNQRAELFFGEALPHLRQECRAASGFTIMFETGVDQSRLIHTNHHLQTSERSNVTLG